MRKGGLLLLSGSLYLSGCNASSDTSLYTADFGCMDQAPGLEIIGKIPAYPSVCESRADSEPDNHWFYHEIDFYQQINETRSIHYEVLWPNEGSSALPSITSSVKEDGSVLAAEFPSRRNPEDPVRSYVYRLENGKLVVVSTLYATSDPDSSGCSKLYLLNPQAGIYDILESAAIIDPQPRTDGDPDITEQFERMLGSAIDAG